MSDTHCANCDRPELCDIILPGTAPCGQNAGSAVLGSSHPRSGEKILGAQLAKMCDSLARAVEERCKKALGDA